MQYRERDKQYANPSKNKHKKRRYNEDGDFIAKKPVKKDRRDKYKRYDTEDF